MAGKRIISEEQLSEVTASDKQSEIPSPSVKGDTHRGADKSGSGETYSTTTKSEVLSKIMSQLSSFNKDQLSDVFAGLYTVPGDAHRAADKTAGESGQVSISSSAVKGGSSGDVHPTMSSSSGSGEHSQIRTSPTAVGSFKEDVDEIFAGEELSEELRNKATVVFEAAINARLISEVARLEEEFEAKLEDLVEEVRQEAIDNVDKYLSYVAEEWVEENKLTIDNAIKVDMAEQFMSGLKDLFESNYVQIPDEAELDVMSEMSEAIEELESELNEKTEELITLKKLNEELSVNLYFESLSEGLAETQVEKLRTLCEGISYDSAEEFVEKASIIRESYFPSKAKSSDDSLLNEEVEYEGNETPNNVGGPMKDYLAVASRLSKTSI